MRKQLEHYRGTLSADFVAGLTGAVAGAPQAMGFAILAGISPIYGLYTAIVSTIIGAFTTGSSMMTVAPTNATALVVGSTLMRFDQASQIERLFLLTVLVGCFQLAFGLLKLGNLTRFFSNAVMTGFITGAGLLIINGQLRHMTGYTLESTASLPQFWEWVTHLPQSDLRTVIIGLATIAIIIVLKPTRLKNAAILIALVATAIFILLAGWESVAIVGDIPSGLPAAVIPDLTFFNDLLVPALALAILNLVQSAALTQNIPEPDGSIPDVNRDFIGQGIANIGTGFFQGMPSGGSLSRTVININAGAKTRMANAFAALSIALIVMLFSPAIERVAMAALAGQLIVAATSLIRPANILTVWRVDPAGRLSMVATFISTLVLPLEYSIYIGVILSSALYVYSSANTLHVDRLVPIGDNRFREEQLPDDLPTHEPIIINVTGNLYFAAVHHLEELLPPADKSKDSVVILRLRGNAYFGSTGIRTLLRYRSKLEAHGGKLILSGISPEVRSQLERTGALMQFGEDSVFFADEVILSSTQKALYFAERWLEKRPPPSTSP